MAFLKMSKERLLDLRETGCVWQALGTGIHSDPGLTHQESKVIHFTAQAFRTNVI